MKIDPSIDIFIRSYYRDFRWLALSLRSIELFAAQYRHVVVVLPEATVRRSGCPPLPPGLAVRVETCEDFGDDYLGQQVTKLHADEYSDADVIVTLDSDNVFIAPCDLRERFVGDGRIRMAYDRSSGRPSTDGFRQCPERLFGTGAPWDVSGAPPIAVPRHLYRGLREYCERSRAMSIGQYAASVGSDRFCEFGLLRTLAWTSEPDRYEWVDAAQPLVPECRTFWSRFSQPIDVVDDLPAALRLAASR